MVPTRGLAAGSSKCTPPVIRGGAVSAQPAVSHPSWVVEMCVSLWVCVCSSPCLRWTGVGNPEASTDTAGAPRQEHGQRLQMTAGWMSFVFLRFFSFIQRAQPRTGSVVTVRWCYGWLLSVGCSTATSFGSLQRGLENCLGKKSTLK